ncbi:helix-turn-helix domain-containing protein [Staphylococcus canis]|uniref:Helix-turn-helix domain-containing protein n=1 Tax=Staphylococcus canis TaxID=2724942 RepID=A0ABS0T849_9STAP|nr:helix-turn-helix domain-containing protein [Staphylococcus canis]MBI5974924.1 helix-turn-helix domain-containing protein [Staphylococcus canis]
MTLKLIGEVLKGKRERLGMTLNELEKRTHIQRETLEKIEKNQFNALSNPNYARGFIMKYAHAVNTDTRNLFKQHEDEFPTSSNDAQNALINLSHQPYTNTTHKDLEAKQLSIIMGVFVVITALFWGLLTFML